ncbi:hypothetical protein IIF7_03851 [Zunongwangia atlantica 22II14-10F7]|uniref:Uncharacterized protein n=1 Tax=Zunongwangia atlantica 22II14-10F7 TaxID=1185767 RepID=A0A1Y1T6E6_9FLAO|nr:hypothetical protein IIF7_03851 [Zunongwangia atlantica 22II14-10F7]
MNSLNFIGTAKEYNTPRLASKSKFVSNECLEGLPQGSLLRVGFFIVAVRAVPATTLTAIAAL